jgi:hypothetical protein
LCSVLRLTDSPNAVGTLSGRVWDSRGLGKLAEPTPSLIYEIETYDETGGGHQRASEEDLVLLVYMRVESILEADTKELRRKILCCSCTSRGREGSWRVYWRRTQRASEEDLMLLVYFRAESIQDADAKELRRKIWCCLCTTRGGEGARGVCWRRTPQSFGGRLGVAGVLTGEIGKGKE